MSIRIEAKNVATATEIPAGELPSDFQWMPPGRHTITATFGGKPGQRTITVTSQTAAVVQADLQRMLADAAAGRGDKPFADLNHNDAEAAFHPTEFYWAGDDPKTGGVRVRGPWTTAGASALLGRLYRRFSPAFMVDEKGNVIGLASENIGGLVNRAAFKNIQPVMAKSADGSDPFLDRVAAVMKEQNVSQDMAWRFVLENELEIWTQHMYAVLGITEEQAQQFGIKLPCESMAKTMTPATHDLTVKLFKSLVPGVGAGPLDQHPFCVAARAEAASANVDFEEGAMRVAAKQRDLYESYCAAVRTAKPAKAKQPEPQRSNAKASVENHAFVVEARALADSARIDFVEAVGRVAAKQPALYVQYREALTSR